MKIMLSTAHPGLQPAWDTRGGEELSGRGPYILNNVQ